MKRLRFIAFLFCFSGSSLLISAQEVGYIRINTDANFYLDNAIIDEMKAAGLRVIEVNTSGILRRYNNPEMELNPQQRELLSLNGVKYVLMHAQTNPPPPLWSDLSFNYSLNSDAVYKITFLIHDIQTSNWRKLYLNINAKESVDNKLSTSSDILIFLKELKRFLPEGENLKSRKSLLKEIEANENPVTSNIDTIKAILENELVRKKSKSESKSNTKGRFIVVRVKERNSANNSPIAIDIYDESFSLKVGDNIIITRTDQVKIPGKNNTIKSETTIGKAKITEDFNKPLYTAKLFANAGFNMKDYKDGDENYNAVIGDENKIIIASPKIMVIPKKIDPTKYVNGEYQLTKEEKMLIAAFKNKFEDNKFTTYGFESSLKSVLENRQLSDKVQDDIKSKILESSGMDFFVEYENLDQNSLKCDKVFDFKIRNYSTGEDVASDVKNLNSCGSPEEYKSFASAILNAGAISKINTQFSSLLNNGRKVSVIFTIASSSQTTFNKDFNGIKLKDHIENCLQGLAFNGNLDIEGVVSLRMETSVNIPLINEDTGKSYTTNTFSEDIIGYLKKNANVECESSVSKQIISIKIK